MSGLSRTAITPVCRKCGVELGQSYVYCADGFMYHHMCYPVSPKEARILELERDLAAATAEIEHLKAELAEERAKPKLKVRRVEREPLTITDPTPSE